MLNGVPEFSQERLDQLVQFKIDGSTRFGIVCKPEMMMAVAKEVAIRCQQNAEDANEEVKDQVKSLPLWDSMRDFLKLTLSLDNWNAPHTFEMTGDKYRQEFTKVAAVVGTKFTIKRLRLDVGWGLVIPSTTVMETLRMIAAQVDQQESKSLSMLEIDEVRNGQNWEAVKLLLKLIEASKEWVIQRVAVANIPRLASPVVSKMIFAELGRCSATGHVGQLVLLPLMETEQWLIKEDVRAVWEITEKVVIFGLRFKNLIGGGRDKDTNVTWEEAYELLNMIC